MSRRSLVLLPLLVALIALGVLAPPPQTAAAVGEITVSNALNPDGADPWIEYYEGNYYSMATTWEPFISMRKSPTLEGLKTAAPVTIWSDTTPGRNSTMWAPDLHRLRGPDGAFHWYLMYTMGDPGTNTPQSLHVLESSGDDPMGPYRYAGRPIPTPEFNIDGSYVQLGGQLYVVWSQFAPDGLQSNWIARMSNPWTAVGPLSILSQPTEPWERIGMPVNEGPVQLTRGNREFIVYSASFCQTDDYSLATLEWNGGDPLQRTSWTKSAGPLFTKAAGAFGPGHNGFFSSPDGTQTWNVYHANPQSGQGCGRARSTRVQRVDFDAAGTPRFGTPAALGAPLAVPSGERGPLTTATKGGRYQLVNRNSGLCAVVAGASSTDGADVVQGTCSTAGNSTWVLDGTADGFYRLVGSGSRKVLDADRCGTADGTDVRQQPWLDNTCQQWRVAPVAGSPGHLTLTGRASGLTLDAANCSTAVGSNIRLWRSLGNDCQQWVLRPVGAATVTSWASGKSFDIAGCSTASGAALSTHSWLGSPCQRYTFTPATAGFMEIHPASAPDLCLTVAGASTADGAPVIQGACGTAAGQWRVEPTPAGGSKLVARHSGKVLDLANCGIADGTALQQWSDLGNDCQRFRIAA